MKKIINIVLIMLCVFAFSACSSGNSDATQTLLDKIKAQGYITVAVSPDFPPYEFVDDTKTGDDQYVGADIELAKYVAEKLGVTLKLEVAEFSTVLASLSTGSADIIISGLGYKEERLEAMDFTKTYNPSTDDENSFQGIMMLATVASEYTSLSDFDGLKIGAQSGSLQQGYVEEQLPNATLEIISDLSTGILMLQTGKIDALAMASTTGSSYVESNPDLAMTTVKFAESALAEYDGTLIGVQKDQPELLEFLNQIVDEVVSQGLFDQWEVEYTEYANSIGA